MTPIYLDSSAVVALIMSEKKSKDCRQILRNYTEYLSSYLLESEVLAASKRENQSFEITQRYISTINLITPPQSLFSELKSLFHIGYCRGADAHHLATALYLDPTTKELAFLTLDKRQNNIAHQLGFKTF